MSNRWERVIVTPSCGCVFCDLALKPTKRAGKMVHKVRSTQRRWVPCLRSKSKQK
jgi:ribosomal protein L28